MDKVIIEILRHLRAMWRYRKLGLFTAWILAVLLAVLIFAVPKKYEASARVFVNTDSILRPLMVGMTVQPDTSQRVSMLSRLLISRPNVEQLIKDAGLDAKVKTTEEYERLVDDVMNVLDIESSGERSNIYVIKYKSKHPEQAKRMVELLVTKFIDTSKGGRTDETDSAKQFLDEQAETYEKKLLEAENRLKEFKMKNMGGAVSTDGRDYVTQMASVKDQLNQAQLQLREAENSRDAYRRGLAGEDLAASPIVNTNASGETVADIDARLDAMKRNLDGLLLKFTESHPDVVGARRVIRDLNEQRRQLVEQYRKSGVPLTQNGQSTGPRASEQLKVSLAQAEASVASLRARVAEYATRYNQLRETARRMPEYEAELAQLNRDYQINKRNYDDLATRRESASIASDMQSVAGEGDFRLVDPPRVSPVKGVSRAIQLVGSMLFALGAGLGLTFVAKEIRARFYDRAQLRDALGLPILGVVSIIVSDDKRRENRKGLRRFALTAIVLFGIYVSVVLTAAMLTKQVVQG